MTRNEQKPFPSIFIHFPPFLLIFIHFSSFLSIFFHFRPFFDFSFLANTFKKRTSTRSARGTAYNIFLSFHMYQFHLHFLPFSSILPHFLKRPNTLPHFLKGLFILSDFLQFSPIFAHFHPFVHPFSSIFIHFHSFSPIVKSPQKIEFRTCIHTTHHQRFSSCILRLLAVH